MDIASASIGSRFEIRRRSVFRAISPQSLTQGPLFRAFERARTASISSWVIHSRSVSPFLNLHTA